MCFIRMKLILLQIELEKSVKHFILIFAFIFDLLKIYVLIINLIEIMCGPARPTPKIKHLQRSSVGVFYFVVEFSK